MQNDEKKEGDDRAIEKTRTDSPRKPSVSQERAKSLELVEPRPAPFLRRSPPLSDRSQSEPRSGASGQSKGGSSSELARRVQWSPSVEQRERSREADRPHSGGKSGKKGKGKGGKKGKDKQKGGYRR